jgi:hypothetical protein
MTDYRFFEESCAEERTYRVKNGWHCDRIMNAVAAELAHGAGNNSPVEITDFLEQYDEEEEEEREECAVRGSHLMAPGEPTGVAAIYEQLGVALPQEVDDFYRQWNGGFLLFQEFYEVMSVEAIIAIAICLDRANRRTQKPLNFLRFCNVLDDCYLALRKNSQELWEVVFCEGGEAPEEHYFDRGNMPPKYEGFRSWLLAMCENDGWPIARGIGGDEPPAERIQD